MPFAAPLALIALASLPTLAAIYYLRNRYRRQVVSSLMLWQHVAAPREGGSRFERLQIPLLMLLELAILAALALAAAGPRVWAAGSRVPLVVVLDDSFSMRARAGRSAHEPPTARDRALADLRTTLDAGRFTARLVIAGRQPQLLAATFASAADLTDIDKQWRCLSVEADLDRALAMARDLAGPVGRLLVLTDHPPEDTITPGRLEWRSFGAPAPNVAITSAHRRDDRCLLEITNYADQPAAVMLRIDALDEAARTTLQTTRLDLAARQRKTFTFTAAAPVEAILESDALLEDSVAMLLPAPPRPVRVRHAFADRRLEQAVIEALAGVSEVTSGNSGADLLFTDASEGVAADPAAWTLRFIAESDARSYLGPFVVDRAHPLTEGLPLEGVIWGAGPSEPLPGRPLVTAGNIVLMTEALMPPRTPLAPPPRDIRIRLTPHASTLLQSPAWPILLANVVEARRDELPGIARSNIRVGETAQLTLRPGDEPGRVTLPDGSVMQLPGGAARLAIPAPLAGRYEIARGQSRWVFAASSIAAAESDLSRAAAGRFGQWSSADEFRWEYRDMAWLLALLGIALLLVHGLLIWRDTRGAAV